METRSIDAIFRALNGAGVRYLVAGGLAVVAHGYLRYTADVDLILDLTEENLRKAVAVFAALNYTPQVPVPLEQFIDAENRSLWIREKQLLVFSLFSASHPKTVVDLFVQPPLNFEHAYRNAATKEIAPGISATIVSLDDLISLKVQAGRPNDLEDIRQLSMRKEPGHG